MSTTARPADVCACGVPWDQVPAGHTRTRGTDGTDHCGTPAEAPTFLAYTTLETLR